MCGYCWQCNESSLLTQTVWQLRQHPPVWHRRQRVELHPHSVTGFVDQFVESVASTTLSLLPQHTTANRRALATTVSLNIFSIVWQMLKDLSLWPFLERASVFLAQSSLCLWTLPGLFTPPTQSTQHQGEPFSAHWCSMEFSNGGVCVFGHGEWVCHCTADSGTFVDSQVSVKIKAQQSLISCCPVILALSSSSLFSSDRTLASRRPGCGICSQGINVTNPPLGAFSPGMNADGPEDVHLTLFC